MKKYFLIILWVSPYLLQAQDLNPYNNIIPPNPDAASLAKYADFPVDLSSGLVQIDIPLWTIKCGDINVPISLSYHASGIPVAETPSYVGLGWTLNAGGAITRTIRGLADDGMEKYGYGTPYETTGLLIGYDYTINTNASDDVQNPGKYRDAAVGVADLEPDMFYYNFCNIAGKFVYDFNGNAHLIPRKNIIIEKEHHSPPGHKRIIKWIMTGDDGLKYYFEEYETTENEIKTEVTLASGAPVNGSLSTNEYNSAWYLTKIKMPNSTDSVVFEYQTITQENIIPVSETEKSVTYFTSDSHVCDGCFSQVVENLTYLRNYYSVDANEVTQSTSTITGKRLSKIIAPDQTVEFISGNYRHDLKGDQSLNTVVIKNKQSEIIKQFKLSYNYFSNNGMATLASADPSADPNTSLRLSLRSVTELDKNGNSLPPHTFEYEYSVWLPDRLTSKAQDHWGYYNGADGNTSLLPYFNAIRDASGTAMKAGSLVKINYPTGGYTQFIYEANNCLYNNTSLTVGGLRIKKKIDYDPVSNKSLCKQYDYNSSGYIGYWPIYDYYTYASGMYVGAVWSGGYHHYTSSSNSAINNGEGGTISYEHVTIIDGDDTIGINGKTENQYTLLRSVNSSPVNSSNPTNQISVILGGGSSQFPFGNAISGAWGTGLLKSQSIYKFKNNGYVKIKELQNTYKSDYWGPTDHYNSETDVLAAKTGAYSTGEHYAYGLEIVTVQFYYIPSRNINLTKTIEIDYDDNENPTTSKVTEIEYDNFSPYIYPSKTTHTLSDGNKLVEQTLYAKDYTNTGSDFVGLMKTNNINKPVEKITYKIVGSNTLITGGGLFTYKVGGNIGKPDKVFKLQAEAPISKSGFKLSNKTTVNALSSDEGTNTSFSLGGIDSRYTNEPVVTYDSYDEYGNPTQITTRNGITSYIWGYNSQYPVAKIENATYTDVKESFNSIYIGYTPSWNALMNGSFISYQSPGSTVYSYLDDSGYRYYVNLIRANFPGARVTAYTYKPLVGMTSVTDANGQTAYYEYDDASRLKYIKDNDSSILKSYNYHYKN